MRPARGPVIEAFRVQAGWCRTLGSPFTAELLAHAAEGLGQGGPTAAALGDWPGDPVGDALALRWAGALHAAVLDASDAALAAAYPRPDRAGDPAAAWEAGEAWAEREPERLRTWLASPPQTNETGRSLALLPGLLAIADRFGLPMDLLELGASAGLNLHGDAFAYRTAAWRRGEGPVVIEGDWRGPPPPLDASLQVRTRRGCDQAPLDPGKAADRLRLAAYVWADQFARRERLQAALALAASSEVRVEPADALDWLRARLAARAPDGVTVVYHSVFLQYPPEPVRAGIVEAMNEAGARATAEAPLAWLRMEPGAVLGHPDEAPFVLDLVAWPGGERRRLADVDAHGRWVEWRG